MGRFVFELSGEHPTLPISEILSLLDSENVDYTYMDVFGGFLVVSLNDIERIKTISNRLSQSHILDEYIFSTRPEKKHLFGRAGEQEIDISGSFRVRCEKRGNIRVDTLQIERELGHIYAKNSKVNLKNPDVEIRVLVSDDRWIVCKKLFSLNRGEYENRKANYRPFFLPISMHPRLARTMVNLSGVKEGEKLLDPFCGTGGILIEAGIVGAMVYGSDIDKRITDGCKQNMDHYGIRHVVIKNCDVGDIEVFGKMDAVVTDFPYGKASTTKREPIETLYRRAFESISSVLKSGKKLVCAVSSIDAVKLGNEFLDLVEVHPVRVHGSLTRFISIFRK